MLLLRALLTPCIHSHAHPHAICPAGSTHTAAVNALLLHPTMLSLSLESTVVAPPL